MNCLEIKARTISGLKIRTKNADEINPKTAKIGALWQTLVLPLALDDSSRFSCD